MRRITVGELFLIPQRNGKFTLGQVLALWPRRPGIAVVALFEPELSQADSALCAKVARDCSATRRLVAVLSTGVGTISPKWWKPMGPVDVTLPADFLPEVPFRTKNRRTKSRTGAVVESAPLVEALIAAFRGFVGWDIPLPRRPGYLKSLLFRKSALQ